MFWPPVHFCLLTPQFLLSFPIFLFPTFFFCCCYCCRRFMPWASFSISSRAARAAQRSRAQRPAPGLGGSPGWAHCRARSTISRPRHLWQRAAPGARGRRGHQRRGRRPLLGFLSPEAVKHGNPAELGAVCQRGRWRAGCEQEHVAWAQCCHRALLQGGLRRASRRIGRYGVFTTGEAPSCFALP